MFRDYVARCERKEIKPGVPYLFKESLFTLKLLIFQRRLIGEQLRIEDIEKGLKILSVKYKEWSIESIAIPLSVVVMGSCYGNLLIIYL